ncbi:dihydroorotase [Oleomonas cavernae]|uniref:Dihydroorotase n=1 Tax=Oleomonas cavernae TaxID=2320859 RepID=A0A418WTN7_9PROT|nr:dihydroorotase [Oleomonas cavernae]RJF94631.1 dihydroorotase [Oleomonas cavernae]
MSQTFDLIVAGGTVVNHDGIGAADVGLRGGRIAAIGDLSQASAGERFAARGLHVLPGVIDSQVHFREPGLEYKEDLATGSLCAVLGGVTAVFEMPNTKPSTTTPDELDHKLALARGRMYCDHAFYAGATDDNMGALAAMEAMPGCAGIKVFMGASTGSLLVAEDEGLEKVLGTGRRRVAIHAEDEARLKERRAIADSGDPADHCNWRDAESALKATRRAVAIARRLGRRIHILHVTTADEIAWLADHKDLVTIETTPQHLTLAAPEAYRRLGTYAQMNPPIRESHHRDGLWAGVRSGMVDVIGSDHAPHTIEEKAKPYPQSPSGMPGVQTLLPLLLDHAAKGRLTLQRLVDLTSAGAQRIFGLSGKGRIALGYDADLTLVDLKATRTITADWLASRCGWSPFEGDTVTGWPMATIIRGHVVMRDGAVEGPALGAPIRFAEVPAAFAG